MEGFFIKITPMYKITEIINPAPVYTPYVIEFNNARWSVNGKDYQDAQPHEQEAFNNFIKQMKNQ